MTREEVYRDIESALGAVPSFFRALPDSSLAKEWELWKRGELEESPIPHKYKELIGLAVAAAIKCKYCAYFHTEAAKLMGATEAEIEDALHMAKNTDGWSTYINGLQLDFEQLKQEVDAAVQYIREQQAVPV